MFDIIINKTVDRAVINPQTKRGMVWIACNLPLAWEHSVQREFAEEIAVAMRGDGLEVDVR
jgi:hypothetical protein